MTHLQRMEEQSSLMVHGLCSEGEIPSAQMVSGDGGTVKTLALFYAIIWVFFLYNFERGLFLFFFSFLLFISSF